MKNLYLKLLLIFLQILCCHIATAQYAIEGVVLDKKSKEPLPFANIYINQSQIGGVSNSRGEFRIFLPNDKVREVFISFVGYKTAKYNYDPRSSGIITFYLEESEMIMEEKIISIDEDTKWQKRLKKFKSGFIGTNNVALQCEIENPWVLEFQNLKGQLVATSGDQVLTIVNKALGFKVYFLLEKFRMGSSLTSYHGLAGFEELEAKDSDEKKQWINNRNEIYNGSLRHFLKSLTTDSLTENGFMVYKAKRSSRGYETEKRAFPLKAKDILKNNTLSFTGFLEVLYVNELSAGLSQKSLLEMVEPSEIYPNGELVNPYAIIARGKMGREMAAYMLPMEFDEPVIFDEGVEFYNKIVLPFGNYRSNNPVEKIHVHTDRSLYFANETIWLKGYINQGDQPSDLSAKMYVTLSQADSAIARVIMKADRGIAIGYLDIPDSLADGQYQLHAYT
ncbi:MAG: carboxypeptidase-like regulatory domain-containing protein, partial [Cyclobacteriaceae bacterium]